MEQLKAIVKKIVYYIDPDIRVSFHDNENTLFIDLKMKEPQMLIGEKGQTLNEVERIIKIIAKRKSSSLVFINLDINDYKKRKKEYLEDLAIEVAREVSKTGVEKGFPPMSAFERRIIHNALKDKEDVETRSVGEKSERRVFIVKKRAI